MKEYHEHLIEEYKDIRELLNKIHDGVKRGLPRVDTTAFSDRLNKIEDMIGDDYIRDLKREYFRDLINKER